jgi:hypothetical protein
MTYHVVVRWLIDLFELFCAIFKLGSYPAIWAATKKCSEMNYFECVNRIFCYILLYLIPYRC